MILTKLYNEYQLITPTHLGEIVLQSYKNMHINLEKALGTIWSTKNQYFPLQQQTRERAASNHIS